MQSLAVKLLGNAIIGVATIAMLGVTGCSASGHRVLPEQLESRVSDMEQATADDHMAAALLYQQRAQSLEKAANDYERKAASLNQHEDPKGFRRSALKTAAQTNYHAAAEMQQLYAEHLLQAETMMGKRDQ
jgi:hypothetical protein